jgi:orotidine-5'-phosphate decarboxylase
VEPRDRLIVALDRSERDEILRLTDQLHGFAGVYKIGLQAFVTNGPDLVREVVGRGSAVFLDLKLHDIPNTAGKATAAAGSLGVSMLTLHASGGSAMIEACVASGREAFRRPLILAVTLLTSLGPADLLSIGWVEDSMTEAVRLARLARKAGADGVVASPLEIEAIRLACGPNFAIVTPGIRGGHDSAADQKRTTGAREAIQRGADYIVVGRPITDAADPRAAAEAMIEEIGSVASS